MIILGSIFSIITIKWTLLEYLETTFGELRSLGGGLRDLNRSPKIVKKGHFWYIQGGTLGCDNLCAGFYVENRSCRSNFPSANLVLGFNQAREGSTDGLKSPTDLLLLGTSCLSTSYVPFRLNCLRLSQYRFWRRRRTTPSLNCLTSSHEDDHLPPYGVSPSSTSYRVHSSLWLRRENLDQGLGF